jgi:glutathione S-transferase
MKLFDAGRAPNSRRTRMFLAEKGIAIPLVPVDLMALDQKSDSFLQMNPRGRVPVLAFDDGTFLSESIAICRYFEEIQPAPPLFGTGALGKATVEMWQRRAELELLNAVAAVFRHSRRSMAALEVPQVAEWAEANKPRVLSFLAFLDQHLREKPFICGEDFTVADVTAFVAVGLMEWARLDMPASLEHLARWHAAVQSRPSASA